MSWVYNNFKGWPIEIEKSVNKYGNKDQQERVKQIYKTVDEIASNQDRQAEKYKQTRQYPEGFIPDLKRDVATLEGFEKELQELEKVLDKLKKEREVMDQTKPEKISEIKKSEPKEKVEKKEQPEAGCGMLNWFACSSKRESIDTKGSKAATEKSKP